MQIEHLTERPGPQSPPASQLAEAPLGDGDRAILGDELSAQPGLAFQRSQLLGGVLEGNAAARALAGQLLVFRAAQPERLPPLLKEIGKAYYRWQPKARPGNSPFKESLAAWLVRTCEAAGLHNTIELVHPGERFDAARHNAASREMRSPRCWAGSCCETMARCIPRRRSPCGETGLTGLGVGGCGLGVGGLFLGTRKPRPVVAVLMAYEDVPVHLVRGGDPAADAADEMPELQASGDWAFSPGPGRRFLRRRRQARHPCPRRRRVPSRPSPLRRREQAAALRRRGRGRDMGPPPPPVDRTPPPAAAPAQPAAPAPPPIPPSPPPQARRPKTTKPAAPLSRHGRSSGRAKPQAEARRPKPDAGATQAGASPAETGATPIPAEEKPPQPKPPSRPIPIRPKRSSGPFRRSRRFPTRPCR